MSAKMRAIALVPGLVTAMTLGLAAPAGAAEVTLTAASCFPIGSPPGKPFEKAIDMINAKGAGELEDRPTAIRQQALHGVLGGGLQVACGIEGGAALDHQRLNSGVGDTGATQQRGLYLEYPACGKKFANLLQQPGPRL